MKPSQPLSIHKNPCRKVDVFDMHSLKVFVRCYLLSSQTMLKATNAWVPARWCFLIVGMIFLGWDAPTSAGYLIKPFQPLSIHKNPCRKVDVFDMHS